MMGDGAGGAQKRDGHHGASSASPTTGHVKLDFLALLLMSTASMKSRRLIGITMKKPSSINVPSLWRPRDNMLERPQAH